MGLLYLMDLIDLIYMIDIKHLIDHMDQMNLLYLICMSYGLMDLKDLMDHNWMGLLC